MQTEKSSLDAAVLAWCADVLGPVEVLADHSREHAGQRAGLYRLGMPSGSCYLKLHRDRGHWESEVHAYEQWAPAFGAYAPRLLAVREEEPLALVISELPGRILDAVRLSEAQERAVWRSAGRALADLHNLPPGECFGPCHRDGTCIGPPVRDARAHVSTELDHWVERGMRTSSLSADELAIIEAARALIPAFAGEHPLACHRDYCPANWLVTAKGDWAGVIDFEFAYWDVRAADFTRDPNWNWLLRPEMAAAFDEGYGRAFTAEEEQQRLFGYTLYALIAIVWGLESDYFIFAAEGRRALKALGGIL